MGRSRGGVFSAAPLYSGCTPPRCIHALLRGTLHKPVARALRLASSASRMLSPYLLISPHISLRLASSASRMLWFPDLTQHDPYYMLPVLSGLSLLPPLEAEDLPVSPRISPYLPVSLRISPYLPVSPRISPYPTCSPPIPPCSQLYSHPSCSRGALNTLHDAVSPP